MSETIEKPDEKLKGRVMWFDPARGFGFIAVEGRRDSLFMHENDLLKSGITGHPAKGQHVRCRIGTHKQKPDKECAVDIEFVSA
jgi:CspA family cold shock protein